MVFATPGRRRGRGKAPRIPRLVSHPVYLSAVGPGPAADDGVDGALTSRLRGGRSIVLSSDYARPMPSSALREPTFLILAALADGPRHGYALIEEASTLSDGRVTLRVGTLYAALDRLAKEGMIEPAGEQTVDGRRRQYYALTSDGAEVLSVEIDRMQNLANRAVSRLRPHPGLL